MNFTIPFACTITASPGSGKTYLIKYLIHKLLLNQQINYVYVVTGTSFNNAYNFLPANNVIQVNDEKEFIKTLGSLMNKQIQTITQGRRLNQCLIVFDDVIGHVNWNKSIYSTLMCNHRHYKVSLIWAPQYVKKIPPLFRGCTMYVFIFKLRSEIEIKAVCEAFLTELSSTKQMKEYFENKFGNVVNYYCLFIDNINNKRMMFKAPRYQQLNFNFVNI